MNNEKIKTYSIEGIDYIKVEDLKWVIKQFKRSIVGRDKMGEIILDGIEIIFRFKRVGKE